MRGNTDRNFKQWRLFSICDALYNSALFVQFQRWVVSRFLYWTNGIKLLKASQMMRVLLDNGLNCWYIFLTIEALSIRELMHRRTTEDD